MRCYHFLNKKYGLEALEKNRLKVSTFDSVNDPFELFCHSLDNRELRKRMGSFKKSTAAEAGMICFSRAMSSPVQWAHYADRHNGICLGFDIPDKFVTAVNYVSERLDFRPDRPWDSEKVDQRVEEAFLTKFDHWRYEEEVRLFGSLGKPDPESGLYFESFSDDICLAEVVVGFASDISRKEIQDILGHNLSKIECYKVRPAFKSFAMVRNRDGKW
ncbi:DUF2971 domain-containing protein [Pseudomonas caricapapayae]|uniref:DUF2971 domain-containing protein n=1 Tax=Pseudomonas caricapapayae TaxID=46678 RepID=UPI0006D6005E|nr:DUF2971 domain-containing protein [Pseudomonas caricapapayae]KAA8689612.1 DUF2971 domain-containing protein [Pseudomonas caricapapayae]